MHILHLVACLLLLAAPEPPTKKNGVARLSRPTARRDGAIMALMQRTFAKLEEASKRSISDIYDV